MIDYTCLYCNNHWSVDHTYGRFTVDACPKCGDKNLTAKKHENSKIDYYAGSPPFPEKSAEKELDSHQNWRFD